ncbi:hypothetical protein B0H67DRAFT_593040 [Lasiosphaeris hirsuta]|uniref:HMG box domain-containing protein n=1 Tax=Lasiosphaeris hirsuta TaxID=260670 RepID=A0AA40DLD2_9PEZI|nr:hypothetical protein B0H67DRAFT_593040 [Lasiosphaeris hirsuta]
MTEVVATSSHTLSASALSGPLTRSAMSTRSAGAGLARQHSPGSSTTAAPFSSASAPSTSPHPPSSPPSRGPMTRKRAASINTEEANHPHPRIEDLSLNTPNTGSPRPLDTNLICLCTPAPKVPRPRNAFILYRQHHQAAVVARNPGLANPEISKIIGENWRDEPEEHKNQWKRLAEEEKQRHQRQYPDYRYQPRRGNKGVPPRLTSTGSGDPGRCDKCGGRYIATPRTPQTPFVTPPSSAMKTPSGMPPPSYSGRGAEMADHHYRQQSQMGGSRGRPQWAGAPTHAQGPGMLYDVYGDYETMPPSEAKRRRYNVAGTYHNQHYPLPSLSTPYGGHHTRAPHPRHSSLSGPSSGPLTPGYGPPPPSGPLPGPSMIARGSPAPGIGPGPGPGPSSGHMGPPPRPGGSISSSSPYPHPQAGRVSGSGPSSEFDESLRLPPLQTHLPTSPASEGSGGGVSMASYNTAPITGSHYQNSRDRDREAHARSVEAMVMSIPYVNKLRVLERISPPLAPPGVSGGGVVSPWSGPELPGMTRGPIIAVEGPDARLLKQVAPIIERALLASGECSVRLWHASADDTQLGAAATSNSSSEDMAMADLARQQRSTTSSRSGSISSAGASNPFSAYLQAMMDWHAKSSEIVKFVTTPPPTARLSNASSIEQPPHDAAKPDTTKPDDTRHPLHRSPPTAGPLPVALLPSGFSLTVSDRFACAVPILDAYAPVDHWQWMATLWRGIAGADLVVYVRAASDEELGRLQGVELKAPGLMVVRVGVKEGPDTEAVVGEKTERRLGFEVVEWVRGGAFYQWHHGGGLGITGNGGWE